MFRNACFERWLAFVLLAWPVLAGAEHWAFMPPQKEPLPTVRNVDWPSNDLDRFILAKLEAVGVAPAKQASRPALVRRLYLDLTGLPPSPEAALAFVGDDPRGLIPGLSSGCWRRRVLGNGRLKTGSILPVSPIRRGMRRIAPVMFGRIVIG